MSETEIPAVPSRSFRLRGREVLRVEAFSDAVFAFAATLLVVSLEVPKTFAELQGSLHGFVAFAFSFSALLAIWTVHNTFFRRFGLQDMTTVVVNGALLFVVLFYVYPLKFLTVSLAEKLLGRVGRAGTETEARIRDVHELGSLFIIYSLGFAAVFFCIALFYWHAARQKAALDLDDLERYDARTTCRHYLIFVAVGIFSMGIAASGIGVRMGAPGWVYALLGPLCAWHGGWRGKRRNAVSLRA
jgi:hypothetical protein